MIGISYGNYNSRTSEQPRYQTAGRSQKSSGNDSFGTKLINGEYYIHVARDENVCKFYTTSEVDKIPSKYELKDGKAFAWCWQEHGVEYRFFHAAESTDENPVLVARGVDEQGKLFEEKIDVRQIDPYNMTYLELNALSYCMPGEHRTISNPYELYAGYKYKGIQERFDFITGAQRTIADCNRLHLPEEASHWTKDMDFILSFTGNPTKPDRIGNNFQLDADSLSNFAKENERNLELYSSAARERMIYGMAQKCSEELSDMLWKK